MSGPLTDWREVVEADIRQRMTRHAHIEPRGWDTIRQRAILHHEIDALIDLLAGDQPPLNPQQQALLNDYAGDTRHGQPDATSCGICGRSRYVNTRAARVCAACDGQPVGSAWESLDGRSVE